MNLQSALKLNLVVATVVFFLSAGGIGVIGQAQEQPSQPKFAGPSPGESSEVQDQASERPPQPMYLPGPMAPKDAKPKGKIKQRPPQPKYGGPPPVKQPKREEPKWPTPQLAGLEMELKDLQEMERDLILRQKQLQDEIAATPQNDKIQQLKYQTAALEVEQELLTVRNESEQLVQRVSYLRQRAASEREAANERIHAHDEIQSIIEKADHLQSAVVHLHEGGLKELAEKVAEESFELRRKADRLAQEAHERSLRRQQEEHQLRKQTEEMIKSLSDKQWNQSLDKPLAHDPMQKEMLGAIRELNQAVRQLREEVEQMRKEIDKR